MNDHLPRFIVVIINHDIIKDVDVFDRNAHKTIGDNVHWLVHQIDILVKRKKAEIQVKRPGALFVGDPKIIFVRMLRRVGKPFYHGSKLEALHGHRAKFNDALNEAVAQIDQKMLTITACNSYAHFDQYGNLSVRGKSDYWQELDELLDEFDRRKIKLLPAPQHPNKEHKHHKQLSKHSNFR